MKVTQKQKLTAYLNRTDFGLPRNVESELWFIPPTPHQQPQIEELKSFFFNDVEFQALKLGTLLTTPDGQLIAAAVEAALPPFYAEDINLIVDALTIAARAQTRSARVAALVSWAVGSVDRIGTAWTDGSAA
jgi:hypothetical protein